MPPYIACRSCEEEQSEGMSYGAAHMQSTAWYKEGAGTPRLASCAASQCDETENQQEPGPV